MHALVLHAQVEGSSESEECWLESARIARRPPTIGRSLGCQYTWPGGLKLERGGLPCQCDIETYNGYLFHQRALQINDCAFSTFLCRGPGPTWRSTFGTLRRNDFICGSALLLANPHDTWADREMSVATVRDDHFPTVVKLIWQSEPPPIRARLHHPLLDCTAVVEDELAELLHYKLALTPRPPGGTPVNARHALVVRLLQAQGSSLSFHCPEGP